MKGKVRPMLERCHYCSKFRCPFEILRLPGRIRMCWHCWEWHLEAMKMLSGQPPKGCQECGVTFAELEKRSDDGNMQMCLHQKDGIYQVLCKHCSDRYVVKRSDLYGETPFGWKRKLS